MAAVDAQSVEPSGWREARRQRILEAASELLAEKPQHLVSVDAVAARAGIGKATLYRYFPSKDDLVVAAFEAAITDVSRRVEDVLDGPGAPGDKLRRVIATLLPGLGPQLRSLKALSDEDAVLAERKRRVFRDLRQNVVDGIARLLAEGAAAGSLRAVEPNTAATVLIGMIWATSVNEVAVPPESLAFHLADLYLHGVQGP